MPNEVINNKSQPAANPRPVTGPNQYTSFDWQEGRRTLPVIKNWAAGGEVPAFLRPVPVSQSMPIDDLVNAQNLNSMRARYYQPVYDQFQRIFQNADTRPYSPAEIKFHQAGKGDHMNINPSYDPADYAKTLDRPTVPQKRTPGGQTRINSPYIRGMYTSGNTAISEGLHPAIRGWDPTRVGELVDAAHQYAPMRAKERGLQPHQMPASWRQGYNAYWGDLNKPGVLNPTNNAGSALGLPQALPMTFNPYGPNKANVAPAYTKVDPARYTNTAQYPWQYQGNKFVNVNQPSAIARTAPGIMRGAGAAMAPVAAIGSVAEMAPHWAASAEEYGYNPSNTAGGWSQSEAAKMKNAPWYKKPVHGLNAMTGQAASGLQNAYKGYKGAYELGGVPGVMGQVSSDANQFLTNTLEGVRSMANNSGLTYKPQKIAPAIGNRVKLPEAGRHLEYAARAPEREQNSQLSQQRAQNYATSAWSGQPQQQSKLPKPAEQFKWQPSHQ